MKEPAKLVLSFERIIKAAKYSKEGLQLAYKEEKAFRDDLIVCSIGFVIACLFANNSEQFFISLISLILLIIIELLNTGLENLADKISPEYCEHCKAAKDLGSASVFLMLIFIIIYHTYLIVF